MSAAVTVLVADEDYVNLLRAEDLGTMPKFLAERASIGVLTEPGLIEFTRMLSPAWSSASARVRLWIAPFEAA